MSEHFIEVDDIMDELRQAIELDVAAGFLDDYEVVERAVDSFSGDVDPAVLEPVVERLTAAAFEAHGRAQATWPAVTDCDRLDAAFAELERRGIVARQNFSCCLNCGSHEIWGEVADAEAEGRAIRGCTFYHEQDTFRAAEGGGVWLAFQAREEGEEASVRVGHEIVDVLRAHGLNPEWRGTADWRIDVPLDWKRRHVTR